MTIIQTSPIPYASNIHSTDPKSAARALKESYSFVFGITRSSNIVKVLLYGYRGADKANIEAEIKKAFEAAAKPGASDISPKQSDILNIWERHALTGKHVLIIASRSEEWIKQAIAYIKEEKKKERESLAPLGAQDVTKTPHNGFTYKTSRALIDNVIAKRQPSLFDEIQNKGDVSYVDQNGKDVSLTAFQMKLITAFAQVLDTQLDREDVDKSIDFLTFEQEEDRYNKGKEQGRLPAWKNEGQGRVSVTIDIPALARLVYSSKKIGGRDLNKVRNEVLSLSKVRQQYKLKKGKKTLILSTPLLHVGKSIKVQKEGGEVLLNRAEIIFEDVFVYGIKDQFALAPLTLLKLWNKAGNTSELFAILLFLMQQVRGLKVKQADRAGEAVRAELKRKKVTPEEIEKQVNIARRHALTYSETIASICERLKDRTAYYQERNGKTYLRKERVTKDLAKAQKDLAQMGIISEYYETINSSREIVSNFVINENWINDETDKIKKIGQIQERPEGDEA